MLFDTIEAVLFDKDGTLFDFSASWSGWAQTVLGALAPGDPALRAALADALKFDLGAGRFDPASPVIAGTLDESAALLLPLLPQMPRARLIDFLLDTAAEAEMVPPVPLVPLLDRLAGQGLVLGVATNDGEAPAHVHLERAGIREHFAEVLGYDSGYTPKPAPDMLLGFAARTGIAPARVVMVGDSTHDLIAGRAAGMATVAVLTGLADAATLAPHADRVLPDISHLPDLLRRA
ncbi:HAD family hydrolase [Natronohydrobacter thiooxidans]|jgi:phosphoglycolate phosphatase|uniref:HAD family hydrolase n=1 Tax=Natronohydrobacter thiooxidans TaxID=87172 RepID=UPI0008FF66A8|nr:HAD family hydrolase [Natronohydrobacter thiooxidans]